MNTIINPNVFYWWYVIDNIKTLMLILSIAGVIGSVIYITSLIVTRADCDNIKEVIFTWGRIRYLFYATPLFIALTVLIPSKDTLIKMYVANNITYERIEKVIKSGKDLQGELKQYVIDILKEIEKGGLK